MMAQQSPSIKTDSSGTDVDEMSGILESYSVRTEQQLRLRLNQYCGKLSNTALLDAIDYSLFNGGKRIRPALVYASAELMDINGEADSIACAIELMHSYSLIHDDLPAMDDDDMRRGKPSCHRQHGEAIAILAGDAMQALAFECLSKASLINDTSKVRLCQTLAESVGIRGMASGQAMDILLAQHKTPENFNVEHIHRLKTGALMKACIVMPMHCVPNITAAVKQSLCNYADDIGLCFQIKDDILDDASNGSSTADNPEQASYINAYGKQGSHQKLQEVAERCVKSLQPLGAKAQTLLNITHYIVNRDI